MNTIFDPQIKILANADRVVEFIETGNAVPVLIEFDPSNACNHGCYFCISSYIHLPESKNLETYSRKIMDKDILMSACQDFVEMGVRAINWTGGGEPTINPHLKEAIQYCGKHGIKMGMFTNGSLFDKFDLFETLVNNMTWVRVSVDSGTEETYNWIRRPKTGHDWNKMMSNLSKLISVNNQFGNKIDIGTGFVITPDTYKEIVDFANTFKDMDLSYCQYKAEVVNKEREDGVQREVNFWKNEVQPRLDEAKEILGSKYQVNGYHIVDLEEDPELYGRHYKKCLGSQLQPCVNADGNVYVCPNHRGYKQYSYGSLYEKSFKEIWNDVIKRKSIMHQIDDVECFSNCTQLCKPHESNKAVWKIYENYQDLSAAEWEEYKKDLYDVSLNLQDKVDHKEFI